MKKAEKREIRSTIETIMFHTWLTLLKVYNLHPQSVYLMYRNVGKILLSSGYMEKFKK